MKYEESIRQVEQIVEQIEQNELDIDALAKNIKTAKTLLEDCQKQLVKAKTETEELLEND